MRGILATSTVFLVLVACGSTDSNDGTAPPMPGARSFDLSSPSYTWDQSGSQLFISFSSFEASTSCPLSGGAATPPTATGHQMFVNVALAEAVCPSGVYPLRTDCAASSASGSFGDCAEYRQWSAAVTTETLVASAGTVTIQQTWVDVDTADCQIDVSLTFDDIGETFERGFVVRVDQAGANAPYCAQ